MDENKNNAPDTAQNESIQFEETFDENEMTMDAAKEVEQPLAGAEEAVDNASAALQAEIEKLQAEIAGFDDKYLRLQADYQNFRKRTSKDVAAARGYAVSDTVTPFLQVFDYFNMAMKAAEQTDNVASLVQGMNMIQAQFSKALEELNVVPFDAVGKKFDPAIHEAVATEPSDSVPEGTVIRQWNCGYKLGDQLLRPARVVVSGGKDAAESKEK